MACEYICDGCGKRAPAEFYKTNPTRHFKPELWFQRGDADGVQDACSRACVEKVAEKTGKRKGIFPF